MGTFLIVMLFYRRRVRRPRQRVSAHFDGSAHQRVIRRMKLSHINTFTKAIMGMKLRLIFVGFVSISKLRV
jgi:hypothetical protein